MLYENDKELLYIIFILDITKELLINNYNVYNLKLTEFNKKYNNFLTDLDSIYDLLLSL